MNFLVLFLIIVGLYTGRIAMLIPLMYYRTETEIINTAYINFTFIRGRNINNTTDFRGILFPSYDHDVRLLSKNTIHPRLLYFFKLGSYVYILQCASDFRED